MGAGSDRMFKRGDAGRLIGGGATARPGVDVGDPKSGPATRGVEIGIEHAPGRAKLELEAGPFAHLQRRVAKMPDDLLRREAEQAPRRRLGRRHGRRRRLHRGLLRSRGAAGEEQGRGENDAAHGALCHCDPGEGKGGVSV